MFFRPIGFSSRQFNPPPSIPHFSAKEKEELSDDDLDALLTNVFRKAEEGDEKAKAWLDKAFKGFGDYLKKEVFGLSEAAQDEFIKNPTLENLDDLQEGSDELDKISFLSSKFRRPPQA